MTKRKMDDVKVSPSLVNPLLADWWPSVYEIPGMAKDAVIHCKLAMVTSFLGEMMAGNKPDLEEHQKAIALILETVTASLLFISNQAYGGEA